MESLLKQGQNLGAALKGELDVTAGAASISALMSNGYSVEKLKKEI